MAVGSHLRRGARPTEQGVLAGAGATLWRHRLAGGPPVCVARTTVALPWPATAQVAEAFGCRAALELLHQVGGDGRRARVVGDNLAVVRYGAGTAALRAQPQQAMLETALAATYARGWRLDWQAVRRRLNGEADRLATRGIRWAVRCRAAGQDRPQQHTEWEPGHGPH